jgi:hypothetical protein
MQLIFADILPESAASNPVGSSQLAVHSARVVVVCKKQTVVQ